MLERIAPPQFRFGGHLAHDDDGRLYDRRTREQLQGVHAGDSELALDFAEVVRAIVITAKAIRHSGERWARTYGLSEVRLQILLLVRHHPDEQLTLGQLADALDVSPRTVTSLVDLLERDRLVLRAPHPHDRRATHVRLTVAGRRLVGRAWEQMVSAQAPVLEGFTADDMAQLRHLCYRLLLNVARPD